MNKLILFKSLSLQQLDSLVITLSHIKLVSLLLLLSMELSAITQFLMLPHVRILSKFMLFGEMYQMLIFMFKSLQETSFRTKTWMEQLVGWLTMSELGLDLKLMKQHVDRLKLEIMLSNWTISKVMHQQMLQLLWEWDQNIIAKLFYLSKLIRPSTMLQLLQ